MTKKKSELPVEEATNFHTDMERAPEAAIGSEDGAEEVMNSDSCQTDLLLEHLKKYGILFLHCEKRAVSFTILFFHLSVISFC